MAKRVKISVEGVDVDVVGRFVRTAVLSDEYFIAAPEPEAFIHKLRSAGIRIDLYTFVQELHEPQPRYSFRRETDEVAVVPLTTFKNWMDKQIGFKCRNKIKKAVKNGVETRIVEFSDELLAGIKDIYDEVPIRQGKKNRHYHKSLDTLRREHSTFLGRSEFIGAYRNGELIGFAKVTHGPRYSIIMNILAKVAHRNLAPANSLITKTIEATTARGIPLLKYGIWGRRGLNDFKVSSAFERREIPRYYVPLTRLGELALKFEWHRGLLQRVPEPWLTRAAEMRERWTTWRYRKSMGAVNKSQSSAPDRTSTDDQD